MIGQVEHVPVVLGWRDAAAVPPRALWEGVEALAWLPAGAGRFVIQVAQRCRTPLVVETARSFAAFLHERQPTATIEIVDPAAGSGEWGRFAVYDTAVDEPLRVAGVAATRGVRVPRIWFESFHLITVVAAHPDPTTRLAAVLDAQADPLRRLGNAYAFDVLQYEAHRLAASDLSIACGSASWNEPTSEHWWAVSSSDIAVDLALASAAGIDPMRLPTLRTFARHELIATQVALHGALPHLRGYVAPAWMARAQATRARVIDAERTVAHDFMIARRNLDKIPGYVRRRLATRRRGAA